MNGLGHITDLTKSLHQQHDFFPFPGEVGARKTYCMNTVTRSSSSEFEVSEESSPPPTIGALLDNVIGVIDVDGDVDGLMNEKWVASWLLGVDGLRKRRLPRR